VLDEIAVWSGDQVRCDEEGYLYFVGRRDALIKTSGYRVSPSEIEEVVAEVSGVIDHAAVGLSDPVLGQRIVVAVVAEAGQEHGVLVERVRHHCRMQMPLYMVPARIHVVESIARTPNGKHDKAALSALLEALSD